MSYILDALRKADAERDRGHVPGIHAQPSFGGLPPTDASGAARPWVWLGAGALAMTVIAAAVWYFVGGSTRQAPPIAAVVPPVAAAVSPPPAFAPAPVIAAAPPPPAPVPVVRKPRPAPALAATPTIANAPIGAAPAAPSALPAAPPASPAAAAADRIYAVNELPEDIRRQLPAVSVGGSMYSPTPSNRVLIVNGQVLHEGDRVAPELTLQQIRAKGAVLNFRGYRYAIGF